MNGQDGGRMKAEGGRMNGQGGGRMKAAEAEGPMDLKERTKQFALRIIRMFLHRTDF